MFFTQEDFKKIEEYLKQNGKKDTDFEALDAKDITSNDSIAVVHDMQNRQVNMFDLLSSDITGFFAKERELLNLKIKELDDLIETFTIEKVGLTDHFGIHNDVAISQRALTEEFDRVWGKIEDITGEVYKGISMMVYPSYYIGEDGCTLHISATTADSNKFDVIGFYRLHNGNEIVLRNGDEIAIAENVERFTFEANITDSMLTNDKITIICRALIDGVPYMRTQTIQHHASYWLGAGNTYTDIMDINHIIPLTEGLRGAYDVFVNDGEHIIIVMAYDFAQDFIRADMNGVEIAFVESIVNEGGYFYKVYTSENVYQEGVYNIDING